MDPGYARASLKPRIMGVVLVSGAIGAGLEPGAVGAGLYPGSAGVWGPRNWPITRQAQSLCLWVPA